MYKLKHEEKRGRLTVVSSSFMLLTFLFLFNISFSSAETFGYGKTETVPINYSTIPTVNNSDYLDGYDSSYFAPVSSLGDYVPYTGATSNVDLGSFNLTTTGRLKVGLGTKEGLYLTGSGTNPPTWRGGSFGYDKQGSTNGGYCWFNYNNQFTCDTIKQSSLTSVGDWYIDNDDGSASFSTISGLSSLSVSSYIESPTWRKDASNGLTMSGSSVLSSISDVLGIDAYFFINPTTDGHTYLAFNNGLANSYYFDWNASSSSNDLYLKRSGVTGDFNLDDMNLVTTGTGTFGSTYQAVLGDDANTRSGNFADGTNQVVIADGIYALDITGNTYQFGIANFDNGSTTVSLNDGTYAINAVGDVYVSGDVSADSFTEFTDVYNGTTPAFNEFKTPLSEYYNPDGTFNHSKWGYAKVDVNVREIVGYENKTTNLCRNVTKQIEVPFAEAVGNYITNTFTLINQTKYNLDGSTYQVEISVVNGTKEAYGVKPNYQFDDLTYKFYKKAVVEECKEITKEVPIYQNITKEGASITKQNAVVRGALTELRSAFEIKNFSGSSALDTNITIADTYLTKSKVPQPNVDYMSLFKIENISKKDQHYGIVLDGEDEYLSVEDRIVALEGAVSQLSVALCFESNNKYDWCDKK